jgi:hypothetical protein
LPLAAVLIVPLLRHRPPGPRRPALWLLGVPIAIVLLPTQYEVNLHQQPFALWAVGAVALAMSIVAARAAIAGAALLVALILPLLGHVREPAELLSYLLLAVPLVVVGTLLMRRQVRL